MQKAAVVASHHSIRNQYFMKPQLLLAAALTALVCHLARADDQDAASRQGGKYHVAAGKTYNMQAHDHARILQKYAALGEQIPAEVVRDHAAAIRFNTEAANRSYTRLGKSAGNNAALAKQVKQLQDRLAKVSGSLKQLEAEAARNTAASKTVIARTNEISRQLRANHNDLRTIDNDFYNSDSDSYYTTGEGHFVD
jgi:hypothetical protein